MGAGPQAPARGRLVAPPVARELAARFATREATRGALEVRRPVAARPPSVSRRRRPNRRSKSGAARVPAPGRQRSARRQRAATGRPRTARRADAARGTRRMLVDAVFTDPRAYFAALPFRVERRLEDARPRRLLVVVGGRPSATRLRFDGGGAAAALSRRRRPACRSGERSGGVRCRPREEASWAPRSDRVAAACAPTMRKRVWALSRQTNARSARCS